MFSHDYVYCVYLRLKLGILKQLYVVWEIHYHDLNDGKVYLWQITHKQINKMQYYTVTKFTLLYLMHYRLIEPMSLCLELKLDKVFCIIVCMYLIIVVERFKSKSLCIDRLGKIICGIHWMKQTNKYY